MSSVRITPSFSNFGMKSKRIPVQTSLDGFASFLLTLHVIGTIHTIAIVAEFTIGKTITVQFEALRFCGLKPFSLKLNRGAEHIGVDMLATHPLRAVAATARAIPRPSSFRPEVKRQADVFADRLMTTLSIRTGLSNLTELLPLPQHPFIRNQNHACSSTCHCPRSGSDKLYELSGCRGSYVPVTSAGSLPMTMSLWNRLSKGRLSEPDFNPLL